MGGRGAGISLTKKQEEAMEDRLQANDAKVSAKYAGARYYEYTDRNGRVHTGESEARGASGGTYRATYSREVADYARKTTPQLQKEMADLKNRSTDQYQKFTRSAASKSASQVASFSDADHKIKVITQILRRRKKR